MLKPVDNLARKLGLLSMVGNLLRLVFSLLFLGLVCSGTLKRAYADNSPATPPGPGLTFAIADFDGDRRPDFASIQAGQNSRGSSDYSIELNLSEVGRQSIDLVAPTGGLLIEARDVDGDNLVDLVVSTAWRRRPVAIFLNDGHGTFSRAETSAFPKAFSECSTNLVSGPVPATDALGISSQTGPGICPDENDSALDRSPTNLILVLSAGFPSDFFQTSQSGRAPPSEAHDS